MQLPADLIADLRRIGARLVDELPPDHVPGIAVMGLRKLAQEWEPVPGWTQYDVICICAALVLQFEHLERDGAV